VAWIDDVRGGGAHADRKLRLTVSLGDGSNRSLLWKLHSGHLRWQPVRADDAPEPGQRQRRHRQNLQGYGEPQHWTQWKLLVGSFYAYASQPLFEADRKQNPWGSFIRVQSVNGTNLNVPLESFSAKFTLALPHIRPSFNFLHLLAC
jgi:hypothetical protein